MMATKEGGEMRSVEKRGGNRSVLSGLREPWQLVGCCLATDETSSDNPGTYQTESKSNDARY